MISLTNITTLCIQTLSVSIIPMWQTLTGISCRNKCDDSFCEELKGDGKCNNSAISESCKLSCGVCTGIVGVLIFQKRYTRINCLYLILSLP